MASSTKSKVGCMTGCVEKLGNKTEAKANKYEPQPKIAAAAAAAAARMHFAWAAAGPGHIQIPFRRRSK